MKSAVCGQVWCSTLLTCHYHRVLFCVLCVFCIYLCMYLCTVHMHLSMHKTETSANKNSLIGLNLWPVGARYICMSVWVCMFVVRPRLWLSLSIGCLGGLHPLTLEDFYFFVINFSSLSTENYIRSSSESLSDSYMAPERASGYSLVSSVLHYGVCITELLFSLVPKLQWSFSIFLDVCFVLLKRPINVLFLTNGHGLFLRLANLFGH